MRPTRVTVSAQGFSPWVPVNYEQIAFGIGLFFIPSSGASLTGKVQHSADSQIPGDSSTVAVSRTGTVATVTWLNHGLSAGDSVIITGSGDANLDSPASSSGGSIGVEVASVIDANNFTYAVANTGATVGAVDTRGARLRVFDHSTMTGLTTRTDGHYNYPVRAIRLNLTAWTSGSADLIIIEGMGR